MVGRLNLVEGDARPDMIEVTPDRPISIGRSRDNNIVIPRDELTSRLHAKVYYENGQWYVQDFGLNGTRVDNERIDHIAEIDHGAEIRIGDVRFRFSLPDSGKTSSAKLKISADMIPNSDCATLSTTRLELDELSILCQFMAQSVDARNSQDLVKLALQNVLSLTSATLAGYLSLDSTDPLTKMVLPESMQVDLPLSRMLTRRIQREGKPVWLCGDSSPTRPVSESLNPFQDALCLPLKAAGESLGACTFTNRTLTLPNAMPAFAKRSLDTWRTVYTF